MTEFWAAFTVAFDLLISADERLLSIVALSLRVSLSAVLIAALIGLPVGAFLALSQFRGRRVVIVALNSLMGLPPVVVGLLVYLALSRSGPFGVWGLLFTPWAMIIAQVILITPIIAALSRQNVQDMWEEYHEQLSSLGCGRFQIVRTLLWDGRFSHLTAILAGFGRASAEVGAVMIVGGNIDHVTRVMTTAIALEVSKGDLALALGLGIVLIILSLGVNAFVFLIGDFARKRMGA